MNCKDAKRLIPAFLDGELGVERSAAVKSHLVDCRTCRQEMAALERTMECLEAPEAIQPAFTLADIRRRASQRRSIGLLWLPPLPRFASAAMLLAAMAIGGISGAYHASQRGAPANLPPAVSAQGVSDSLGLDAFDNGLAGAIYVADTGPAPMTEVAR